MEDINLHLLDEHNDWQIVRRPTGIFITGLTKHNVRVDAGRFACNWDGFGIVDKVSDTYLKRKIPQYIHYRLREFWRSGCASQYDRYMGEVLRDDIDYMLDDILNEELKHVNFILTIDPVTMDLPLQDVRHHKLKELMLRSDIIGQAYAAQPVIECHGFCDWLDMWVVAFINCMKYKHYVEEVPDLTPHLLASAQ